MIPVAAGIGEPEFGCHHGIVPNLLGSSASATNGGLDAVIDELRSTDAPASCISSEDLSVLYDRPELLTQLRDAIRAAGFEPTIVVYLRSQVSYSIAIYAANIQRGYRLPFSAFLADLFEHGCVRWDAGTGPPYDYPRLLDAFAAIFGRDRLIARRFRSDAADRALLLNFIRQMIPGSANLDSLAIAAKRANRTLTFGAVLDVLGIENDIDQHVRFAPLNVDQLVAFWARFNESNRDLAARYGVHVPVFEPVDIARALPIRRTWARTRQLGHARKTFRKIVCAGAIETIAPNPTARC